MRGCTELDSPFLLCELGQVAAHGWVTNRYASHSYCLLNVVQRHLPRRRDSQLEYFSSMANGCCWCSSKTYAASWG